MMPSGNSHKKDYAFVIEKKVDHEEIYQVYIDDALAIAKASDNLVFIYYGKYRYHYCNGEPLLSIIENSDYGLSDNCRSSGE